MGTKVNFDPPLGHVGEHARKSSSHSTSEREPIDYYTIMQECDLHPSFKCRPSIVSPVCSQFHFGFVILDHLLEPINQNMKR